MSAMNESLVAVANRLYWQSEASVAEIAEQLGLSRRGLYAILRPEPAGGRCPECGGELVYPTRSARAAGAPSCRDCGPVEAAAGEAGQPAGSLPEAEPEVEQELDAGRLAPIGTSGAALRARAIFIGSAALAGVAVGATIALLASRRR
jgi:hypothetical protein